MERGSVSVQYLDRTEAGRLHTSEAEEMGDKRRKKKEQDSSKSDRVTLKKEIGLLSACAIIIGECLTAFVWNNEVSSERFAEPSPAVAVGD